MWLVPSHSGHACLLHKFLQFLELLCESIYLCLGLCTFLCQGLHHMHCDVILSTFLLFECTCSIMPFYVSNYVIIFSAFSYSGSNWACLVCLSPFIIFKYTCIFLISCMLFNLSEILIIFCLCFKSWTTTFIFSSLWSKFWIHSSSSRHV